jgi:hypothetical protein
VTFALVLGELAFSSPTLMLPASLPQTHVTLQLFLSVSFEVANDYTQVINTL